MAGSDQCPAKGPFSVWRVPTPCRVPLAGTPPSHGLFSHMRMTSPPTPEALDPSSVLLLPPVQSIE